MKTKLILTVQTGIESYMVFKTLDLPFLCQPGMIVYDASEQLTVNTVGFKTEDCGSLWVDLGTYKSKLANIDDAIGFFLNFGWNKYSI